ncbi:hypothetical protein QQW99_19565 [Bacillus amyloliquefaciens]|uniref:hypothetical protein n=1 Tax=Bacillus amyloliquefaciens TaxID=1390 RepID=UPI00255C1F29|nr:hypothetical protein [Bacillus amyloliquefaciens]WIX31190.1 hypothetical protein QQW99_19565 [Bacillus amyloliquefaciens]
MRVVGYWVGKARGVSRSFRQGFDNMVREAELEEMEKRWAAENARIMAEHPATSDAESAAAAEPATPLPRQYPYPCRAGAMRVGARAVAAAGTANPPA